MSDVVPHGNEAPRILDVALAARFRQAGATSDACLQCARPLGAACSCSGPARWRPCAAASARIRWSPMPLATLENLSRKCQARAPALLALTSAAGHNMSANTDAQGRPAAARRSLGRRLLLRYEACALNIESMGCGSGARAGCAAAGSLFWGWRNSRSGGLLGQMAAEGVAAACGRAASFDGLHRSFRCVGAPPLLVSASPPVLGWSSGVHPRLKAWAMPPATGQHRGNTTTASHNLSYMDSPSTARN